MEVIGCDRCQKMLGEKQKHDVPTVNPANVYEAEDERVQKEFADGWLLTVFPSSSDPIALETWHDCPECWSEESE